MDVWIEEENRDVEGGEEEKESQFIQWRKGGLASGDKKSQRDLDDNNWQ
jgi:hypothetical protein